MTKFDFPLALVLLQVFLIGCGGGVKDADPSLVPVSGTVSAASSPLNGGTITLTGNGQSYSGVIAEDGTYEVKASPSAPGAVPGSYKVAVMSWSQAPGMDEDGKLIEGTSAIDAKYNSPETSGLTVEIKADGGPYDFDL